MAAGRKSEKPSVTPRLPLVLLVASGWTCYFALPFSTGTNTGRVVALMLCAAVWLTVWAMGRLPVAPARTRMIDIAALTLGVTVVLSSAVSPYAARALTWGSLGWFGAPVWVALIAIFLGVIRVPIGRSEAGWVAGAFGWVLPSLVLAVSEVVRGVPVAGGFNTGNHFGAAMVATLPIALWVGGFAKHRSLRYCALVAAAGCAAGALASRSAAAMLGLAVVLASIAMISPALPGAGSAAARRGLRIAVAALVCAGAVFLVLPFATSAVPAWWSNAVQEDVFGTTFLTRVEMWKAGWRVFATHPLFGSGPDTFHLAAQPVLSARLYELESASGLVAAPPDPHSLPMLLLSSFGLLGLGAFAFLGVSWARSLRRDTSAEPDDVTALRSAAAVAALGVFTALLFMPWAAVLGALPVLVAALAAGVPRDVQLQVPLRPAWPAALAAAAAALTLFGLSAALVTGVVLIDRANSAESAAGAVKIYQQAASVMPTYPFPRFRTLHAEGEQLGPDPRALSSWQDRVVAERSTAEDATYAIAFVRDSLDQAFRWQRSDLAWEKAQLEGVARRFPALPDLALERAHLALLEGDAAGARRLLADAEPVAGANPRLDLYRYYLAVLEGDQQQAAELRAQLETVFGPQALLDPQ